MRIAFVSFTQKGAVLAQKLCPQFETTTHTAAQDVPDFSLHAFAENAFSSADALVFIGAAGIAVRAIAPFVRSKTTDPAVVVMDENAQFVIPILSGHLGGANALARKLAFACNAVAVITTATDVNAIFAVDEWAKKQGCHVLNPQKIKTISAALLAGKSVRFQTAWHVKGDAPVGIETVSDAGDFCLTIKEVKSDALLLVPRILVLGIGCRKGTAQQTIETAFATLLQQEHLYEAAIYRVCSIDLKQSEPGILAFCHAHGFPFETFSAAQLQTAQGAFSASSFVQSVTGVDNVCERSAVIGSGGQLFCKKNAGNGVTMALGIKPFCPDWSL